MRYGIFVSNIGTHSAATVPDLVAEAEWLESLHDARGPLDEQLAIVRAGPPA